MDARGWEEEIGSARARLLESNDFHMLRRRGHQLKHGVALTSVSKVPFEMSLRCVRCGAAFWFENLTWVTGGISEWQISSISIKDSNVICGAVAMTL
jgi:hypothetical protein